MIKLYTGRHIFGKNCLQADIFIWTACRQVCILIEIALGRYFDRNTVYPMRPQFQASIRAQCISLHGRLELIGSGVGEAAARRSAALAMAHTMELDRVTFLQTLRAPQHGVR